MIKRVDFLTCQIAKMTNTTLGSISEHVKDMTCVCRQSEWFNTCSVTQFYDSLQISV